MNQQPCLNGADRQRHIEPLLAPIAGDAPAGQPVALSIRASLEAARKVTDPDNPHRPDEPRQPDWEDIIALATQVLRESSKDLTVAARLTEAWTKQDGYAGLADGLQLLRRLLEECWDRLHPAIDDGDLEVRAGPFNWLGEDDRGACFPHTLRAVPLFEGEHGLRYTLHDWKKVQEGKRDVRREDYERAINHASREHCQGLVDGLNRSAEELTRLLAVLDARLGGSAPSLTDVRAALAEALVLANHALSLKAAPARTEAATGPSAAPVEQAPATVTRADIYQHLARAADLLEGMEPHSPVPYLIRRAVALGRMPFPQMMRALFREEFHPALNGMSHELGILNNPKPQTAPGGSA
jgi:type VI secretion system protein ImpA